MFLSAPDVPVERRLTITLPDSAWKQLDAMSKELGVKGVVEHTIAGFLLEALRKEARSARRNSPKPDGAGGLA